jgi:hypothetical protein
VLSAREQGGGGGRAAEDEASVNDGWGFVGDKASGNDDGGHEGDEFDGDYLEKMLRVIGLEVILKSAKGLNNLERVKKERRRVCMVLTKVVWHTWRCYVFCLCSSEG